MHSQRSPPSPHTQSTIACRLPHHHHHHHPTIRNPRAPAEGRACNRDKQKQKEPKFPAEDRLSQLASPRSTPAVVCSTLDARRSPFARSARQLESSHDSQTNRQSEAATQDERPGDPRTENRSLRQACRPSRLKSWSSARKASGRRHW